MAAKIEPTNVKQLPAADTARMVLDETAMAAARRSLDQGAVTPSYGTGPWRKDVIKLLNDSLATELVCVLRYKRHHFTAQGLSSPKIAEEFLVHANEESAHADRLAKRIVQLGGEPDFSPRDLGPRSEPGDRRRDVGEHASIRQAMQESHHGGHVRGRPGHLPARVEIERQSDEAGTGQALGGAVVRVVQTPDVVDHDHARPRQPRPRIARGLLGKVERAAEPDGAARELDVHASASRCLHT